MWPLDCITHASSQCKEFGPPLQGADGRYGGRFVQKQDNRLSDRRNGSAFESGILDKLRSKLSSHPEAYRPNGKRAAAGMTWPDARASPKLSTLSRSGRSVRPGLWC